jgi:hypothetical protein
MVDGLVRIFFVQVLVATHWSVQSKLTLVGNGFANERGQHIGGNVLNHTGNHVALAPYSADNDSLSSIASAAAIRTSVATEAHRPNSMTA